MIIMIRFVNRKEEIKILEDIANSDRAELVLLYGRRRVGKSALLLQFAKKYDAQYFLADASQNILDILSSQVVDRFVRFGNWEDFFLYILESEKKIFIIDEFQYIYRVNRAWPTQLQRWWEKIKERKKKVILCGSIISTIYRIAKGYGSALYGRKTREMKIDPLRFPAVVDFFQNRKLEDIVKFYALTGGVPRYMEEMDTKRSVEWNIKNRILEKTSFLYNEPMNLMFEEFRDPAPYISIISAIVNGYTKFSDIATYSGIDAHKLYKYLMSLERVDIITKDIPVTERKIKVKRTKYCVKDNFYRFWFRFVFPNRAMLEMGLATEVYRKIERDFSQYVGQVFEDIVRGIFPLFKIGTYDSMGRWWHKDTEIDIVALNHDTNEIFFGEVKWKSNVRCQKIMDELRKKAEKVPWERGGRKEKYAVFAKNFRDKKDGCFDLQDIGKVVKK